MAEDLLKKVVFPASGKYILAVSGGMDSVCLLHLMAKSAKNRDYDLVIAHLDHGLREDSASDAEFVKAISKAYGLLYVGERVKLGEKASEEKARDTRYRFLRKVTQKTEAKGIMTAHHLDDVLETAIFNAGRGASSEGLTPMHLATAPLRPFLNLRKADLRRYAKINGLKWREDSTNDDLRLARNFIRQRIVPLLSKTDIEDILALAKENQVRVEEANGLIAKYSNTSKHGYKLSREYFLTLSHDQLVLLIKMILRRLRISMQNDRLSALVNFLKSASQGTEFQGNAKLRVYIHNDMITLTKN